MDRIICVDFDGTVVTHEYPEIGKEVAGAVKVLKRLQDEGCRLILWTMRSGEFLQQAVDWFTEREIELFGVNVNPDQASWTDSPKAYAQVYIDDAALGCPLRPAFDGGRPFVDWWQVEQVLFPASTSTQTSDTGADQSANDTNTTVR